MDDVRIHQPHPRAVLARTARPGAASLIGLAILIPYALSSFFSSLRNRQSVPCAMIFCGVELIIPTPYAGDFGGGLAQATGGMSLPSANRSGCPTEWKLDPPAVD